MCISTGMPANADRANLSILKTGKAKAIRFSTLAAICEALDCQPGDILEYQSGKPDRALRLAKR